MPDSYLKRKIPVLFFSIILLILSFHCYSQYNNSYPDSGYTITTDTTLSQNGQFISKIQKMYFVLGRITSSADREIDTKEMDDKLPDIDSNLSIITESLNKQDKRVNIRNLQLFQILTQDMIGDMRDWQSTLQDYNKTLINMESDVSDIAKDSTLHGTSYNKTLDKDYAKQLKEIRQRVHIADSTTDSNLAKVDKLQGKIAEDFMTAIDLRKKIRQKISGFGQKIMSQEYAYLWQDDSSENNIRLSQLAVPRERKILRYYFKNSWDDRVEMAILWVIFFVWVFVNFITANKNNQFQNAEFKIHFLKPLPFMSGFVLILTLAPFFDLHPPAMYVNILQFWLLVALTILLWRNWPKRLFYSWISIVLLFFLFSFVPLFMNSLFGQRMWFLILDIVAILICIIFYFQISKSWSMAWLIKTIIIIAAFLNILAITGNLLGRVTLSQILSNAAIFGLTQIIGLSVFMKIIYESVYLQMFKMRLQGGVSTDVEFATVEKRLNPILTGLCLVLWLMVFTTNINLYDGIYTAIQHFLDKPRSIGTNSFSYGSIVVFFVIIYVANFIQKNIGYVWGRTSDELLPTKRSKIGSRLLFMRMILLTIGFLLAVAASGLPLDKITIILGALGVGIGLGLQSIVNNLVSGIVLIFERPIEVGDSIEIGGNKGTVKEIGLRSSTLIAGSGAEIIVPNGDFLSQHIVNWTLSNAYIRIELPLNVPSDSDIALVSKTITEEVTNHPNVMADHSISVIVNSIDQSKTSLTTYFWCSDVRKADQLRSDVLKNIKDKLLGNGIKIL